MSTEHHVIVTFRGLLYVGDPYENIVVDDVFTALHTARSDVQSSWAILS